MPLYFAYGSCMNQKDIARTVDAEFIGAGRLHNYKLAFTRYAEFRGGGAADIVESEGSYVEGVIFQVPDFKRLDAREGHPYIYKRREISLQVTGTDYFVDGSTYEVVNKSPHEYQPSKHYAHLMTAGAKQYLSNEYQVALAENLQLERYVRAPKVKKTTRKTYRAYDSYEDYKPSENYSYKNNYNQYDNTYSNYDEYDKPLALFDEYDDYDSPETYAKYSSYKSYSRILDNWIDL